MGTIAVATGVADVVAVGAAGAVAARVGAIVGIVVGATVWGTGVVAMVRVGDGVGSDSQAASPTIKALTVAKTSQMSSRKSSPMLIILSSYFTA